MAVLDVFNWEGVSVAPSSTIFTVTPTWTRLDNAGGGLRVAEVQIRRGRQTEFDQTNTGEMTVTFRDRDGDVDPTSVDWVSRPMAFAVRNPVTDTWHPRFRGGIDDHDYSLSPGQVKGDVTITAVDALDYFANVQLAPGLFGDTPPAESEGYVWFEDTTGASVGGPVGVRIRQALTNSDWPTGLRSVFTGNSALIETVYSPGESILTVIRDAAEAEFPGVANFFVDKYGVVCFHGRLARFDPATVASTATHWDFNTWTLGSGGAQITWPFQVQKSRRMIRNAAMCYPQALEGGVPFPRADRANQVVTDATSIATHGVRSWTTENLQVKEGVTTTLSGPDECLAFAQYIIDNYADPAPRLSQVTLKPVRPTDPRASAIWAMACEADISDQVTVVKSHPGGGGVNETFFIEGITETWRPLVDDLDTGYPYFEITYDLSPTTYWTTEVGG